MKGVRHRSGECQGVRYYASARRTARGRHEFPAAPRIATAAGPLAGLAPDERTVYGFIALPGGIAFTYSIEVADVDDDGDLDVQHRALSHSYRSTC